MLVKKRNKTLPQLNDTTESSPMVLKKRNKPSSQLNNLCDKLITLTSAYETAQDIVKDLKKEMDQLSGDLIPECAEEISEGLKWLTTDGRKAHVITDIKTNIADYKMEDAHDELRELGSGPIIKKSYTVTFDGSDTVKINKYRAWLSDQGLSAVSKSAINAATLKSTIKEWIEQGVDFDRELFGVFDYKKVKIDKLKC